MKAVGGTADRRSYANGNDLLLYREMMDKVNEKLEKAIDDMPISMREYVMTDMDTDYTEIFKT